MGTPPPHAALEPQWLSGTHGYTRRGTPARGHWLQRKSTSGYAGTPFGDRQRLCDSMNKKRAP